MLEADLAYQGHDLRDLFRPGSGMTLRRLRVLISGLPPDAAIWTAVHEAAAKAENERKLHELEARAARYGRRGDG